MQTNNANHFTRYGALVLLCSGVFAFYTWLTGAADYAGLVADDAVYLLMAERFAGNIENLLVHDYINSVSHFPPLWPLIIGLLDVNTDILARAHALQNLFIALSTFVIGLFALQLQASRAVAFSVAIVFAVSPAIMLLSVEIWSEFLFILLIYLAFTLLHNKDANTLTICFASLLIGLAAITRGFGLVACVALLICTLVNRPGQLRSVILGGSFPLVLSWIAGWGGSQSYITIFSDRVSSFSSLIAVMIENSLAIWRGCLHFFDRTPNIFTICLGVLILVLFTITLWERCRKFQIDSWFCLGYLVLLLIWPFPAVIERLIIPIAPLIMLFALLPVSKLASSISLTRGRNIEYWPSLALCGVLAAAILPNSYTLLKNFAEPLPGHLQYLAASRNWMSIADRNIALHRVEAAHSIITGLRRAKEIVPVSDCLYAQRPQIVMYYIKRPSYPASTSKTRNAKPQCRYHILINDGSLENGLRTMWPSYEVVLTEKDRGTAMVIVARYPEIRSDASPVSK